MSYERCKRETESLDEICAKVHKSKSRSFVGTERLDGTEGITCVEMAEDEKKLRALWRKEAKLRREAAKQAAAKECAREKSKVNALIDASSASSSTSSSIEHNGSEPV